MSRKLSGVLIQHKTGTTSQWTSVNPTLAKGEIGFETDTAKMKIGDGVTTYNNLPYLGESAASNLNLITGKSFAGIQITGTGNSTITASTLNNPFTGVGNISTSINASITGENGIDVDSLSASTFYYVFLCYGISGVCGLLSKSSSGPILPTGYDMKAVRIGACKTNANAYLYRFTQYGDIFSYVIDGVILTSYPVVPNGATSWTEFTLTDFVPETYKATNCSLYKNGEYGAGISISSTKSDSGRIVKIGNTSSYYTDQTMSICLPRLNNYYYNMNSSNHHIYVVGWIDNL